MYKLIPLLLLKLPVIAVQSSRILSPHSPHRLQAPEKGRPIRPRRLTVVAAGRRRRGIGARKRRTGQKPKQEAGTPTWGPEQERVFQMWAEKQDAQLDAQLEKQIAIEQAVAIGIFSVIALVLTSSR